MRYQFTIPIGDWSGDGHGQCDDFDATAAKDIEEVRKAYFAAKEKLKEVCPETFCNGYEESEIPDDVCNELERLGAPLTKQTLSFGRGER